MFRRAFILPLAAVLFAAGLAPRPGEAQPVVADNTIGALILELQGSGIRIIYSDDLLDPGLLLPAGVSGRSLADLETALTAHALRLQPGPRGSWVIGARDARPPTPADDRSPPGFEITPPALENIVVSASRYSVARSGAVSPQLLDRRTLEHLPALGDDALRTLAALPGVSSSGLSSRSSIRGGATDESLLLLDGVRLYDPYHLRQFEALFSSINPRVIEQIDVYAGGYPAEYGDRLSGVIDMHTVTPADEPRFEFGLSTLATSFLSSGRFGDGRGGWVTSLRRGNLDLLMEAARSDAGSPAYADFYGKIFVDVGATGRFEAGALRLNDELLLDDGEEGQASANYDDSYVWLRYTHSALDERLTARYLFSSTLLHGERQGSLNNPALVTGSLSDRRRIRSRALRADFEFSPAAASSLQAGFEWRGNDSAYGVLRERLLSLPIHTPEFSQAPAVLAGEPTFRNQQQSLYLDVRRRFGETVVLEGGLRRDTQSYLAESQNSPRLSLRWDAGERSTWRVSWGKYYQASGVNELAVADGQLEPAAAQRGKHLIVSYEYALTDRLLLRTEAYRKRFSVVRPRYENLFLRISLLPELLPDRVRIAPERSRAQGIDVSLEASGETFRWWLSASRQRVDDRIAGDWHPRSWAEPWSGKFGFERSGAKWTVAGVLTLRSGWPVSTLGVTAGGLALSGYHDAAFEQFRSLDVRASRRIPTARGAFELIAELDNALDFYNPCCTEYTVERDNNGGLAGIRTETSGWLPMVPSLGFLWQF